MSQSQSSFDQLPRYVRVRSAPHAAFVEFDFAIGYPDLFVELVLPPDAFARFCTQNQVQHMDEAMAASVDADMEKWRYGVSQEADA
ncbi:phenol hydroxylase [Pseudomonas sp. CrR25]|nr:phenol hydroxylase [Pseudomonas sp. CrR25]